ncbi:hypothetical protein ACG2LH_03135 [Zhouia sp. PK063]|uniref:hypothetical protein n=1 Tax=Zhouia sp. PK063 TaxID=3373602 RepID=UPI0037B803F0
MKKKLLFKWILAFIIVIGILLIAANYVLSTTLKKKVNELHSDKWAISCTDAHVNIFFGTASLSNFSLKSEKKQRNNLQLSLNNAQLTGISIFNIFSHKNLNFSNLNIKNGKLFIIKNDSIARMKKKDFTESSNQKENNFESFDLENFHIENLKIVYILGANDTLVSAAHVNINLKKIHTSPKKLQEEIPFDYVLDNISSDSLFYRMNNLENIRAKHLNIDAKKLHVKQFSITSPWSRATFQKHITRENDRITLKVDSLNVLNYKFKINRRLSDLFMQKLNLYNANLQLYRNKLPPDQIKFKPLYSRMLRELSLGLQVDTIKVHHSNITYLEHLNFSIPPGKLSFNDFNATITGINNHKNSKGHTNLDISCRFMNDAPLVVNWSFDIADKTDAFKINGHLQNFDAQKVNSFLEPNMNVDLEGQVTQMYFNFAGNNYTAGGKMRLAYKDFKVNILHKDRKGVKKLFSAIANIFIATDKPFTKENSEKYQGIERNQEKSFFNYFWLCIKKGTISTMI